MPLNGLRFRFRRRSQTSKVPYELIADVERHGTYLPDGATIETTRRMGTGKKARDRRVVYHYSFKRAQHVTAQPRIPGEAQSLLNDLGWSGH